MKYTDDYSAKFRYLLMGGQAIAVGGPAVVLDGLPKAEYCLSVGKAEGEKIDLVI